MGVVRSALIAGTAAVAALALAGGAAGALRFTGVNLSGAEFGQTSLPGTYNTHYTYPTNAEVDYFTSKGMYSFRLPLRWERLQRTQFGALDSAEVARLDAFVNYATNKGAQVVIDPHNFARYYPSPAGNYQDSTVGVVGGDVPNTALADFWSKVAGRYKSNPRVAFNLMNEPANINVEQWLGAANASIAAIRNAGAANLILVPGVRWTGAWTWNNSDQWGRSNASAMLNIVDPGNNFAFDVHQYLDSDGSGSTAGIANNNTNVGVQRLTSFTNWLKANGRKGYLGEFAVANSTIGAGASQIGDETLVKMLDYIRANDDVWLGWAWWGGGPWWGNYMFALDPSGGVDRAAMGVLRNYVAPGPVAGDADGDGDVDSSDLAALVNGYQNRLTGLANGDFNRDGRVSADDFATFGLAAAAHGPAATEAAVPEPFAGAACVAAALAAAGRGRRRSARSEGPSSK